MCGCACISRETNNQNGGNLYLFKIDLMGSKYCEQYRWSVRI